MSSWDHFEETQLPPIEAFYSNLSMSNVSEDDYEHAQKVWKDFGIHNLGDYHDLYLRTDIILLANVFEAFRVPLHEPGLNVNLGQLTRCGKNQVLFTRARVVIN